MSKSLEDLTWLVKRRSRIQSFLLGLLRDFPERSSSRTTHEIVTLQLLGAGYSLWRAVFLATSSREWDTLSSQARTFLERLVRDNAIAYKQESDAKDWTSGYYLNNAYHRLRTCYKILKMDTDLRRAVSKYLTSQESTKVKTPATRPWDTAYEATVEVFNEIQRRQKGDRKTGRRRSNLQAARSKAAGRKHVKRPLRIRG